jgi:hypothetical protein
MDPKGNPKNDSPWLTLGKSYEVLSVIFDTRGRWLLRLVGDANNGVALFDMKQFEIVSSRIPVTWNAIWSSNGVFELTPLAWSQSGFWTKYYDRDPEAIELFKKEAKNILDFENRSQQAG